MTNTHRMTAVLATLVLLGSSRSHAQDWPQWRGANRDGKATEFTVPATWPRELTKKWQVPVGGGDSSPALVGDRLYVFGRQGDDEVLRCLDVATGKQIWKEQYPSKGAEGPAGGMHAGPRSSPAVADGKVVTLGVRGILSCFDAASGKLLWRKDQIQGWPMFYTASSPLVVNGLCIAQLGGTKNGAIVAYDLTTGDEKWKWSGQSPAYSSPVLLTVNGTTLVVAETEEDIVALHEADGKVAWEAPFKAERMAYNAATPIVDGQMIIYSGVGRGTRAVEIEKQGDSFKGKDLWTSKEAVQFNTPVVKDGSLFGLTQSNQFFAVNVQNGKTEWTAPAPQASGGGQPAGGRGGRGGPGGRGGRGMRGGRGGGYGSIVAAGSVLLALTPSGELVVFQPSDKEFKELAHYKVATTPTYAYPVVSGNRIFVKDQESVTLWTVE
jgi:outer membrane protein assembly factor BamB